MPAHLLPVAAIVEPEAHAQEPVADHVALHEPSLPAEVGGDRGAQAAEAVERAGGRGRLGDAEPACDLAEGEVVEQAEQDDLALLGWQTGEAVADGPAERLVVFRVSVVDRRLISVV